MIGRQDWISEGELHAYLDDELDSERRQAVEDHLASHSQDATRLQSYQRHGVMLRRVYGPLLERPIPPAMIARLRRGPRRSRPAPWLRAVAAMAAAIVLFIAGAGAGWWLRQSYPPVPPDGARFVADAVSAHTVYAVEVRHPVEVEADQKDHLLTWLSKRLGRPLVAPDLASLGFELVGGRLLPAEVGPAAQLMYQDASGRRMTLYVRESADPEETAFRFVRQGKVAALYWREGGMSWALLGELPRQDLLRLGHRVYEALNS